MVRKNILTEFSKNQMHKLLYFIKCVGGSYLLLELAVLTSFFGFTLNPGALGEFMRIAGSIFIFNVLIGNYRLKQLTQGHIIFFAIFMLLLVIHFLVPDGTVHRRSVRYFLAFPWLIMAIHCLAVRRSTAEHKLPEFLYLSVVILAVLIQFIAYQFFSAHESWGMYGNFHHFGYFTSLTIPLLWYFLSLSKDRIRLLIGLTILADLYLLLESSSRIAWLAFFSSIFLTSLIFFKLRQILMGILAFIIIFCLAVAFSGFSDAGNRILDFFAQWRTEERVALWSDTLRLLSENSLQDWIFGHGIGSFRYHFEIFTNTSEASTSIYHVFPHNVFFQIIFENGLIGFSIIFGGIAWLLLSLWRGYSRLRNKNDRNLLIVTFALFWINLVYCGLTQSFYSKFSLYPLSLICGIAFVLLEKASLNKPWHVWKLLKRFHR
jgi:O-antigen ligase